MTTLHLCLEGKMGGEGHVGCYGGPALNIWYNLLMGKDGCLFYQLSLNTLSHLPSQPQYRGPFKGTIK